MIVGLVAMYMPKVNEIRNIEKYIFDLDFCFLLDDSAVDNSRIVKGLVENGNDKVEYHCNSHNLGLCASVNNGFKMAIAKGADWILLMNPDGTFQNNAIEIYKDYIKNNDVSKTAIIAPRFNIDRRKKVAGKGTSKIKYPDMTGCLYNAKILEKMGFYDQNTYFYGLDVEYCIRVRSCGYNIIECSEAVLNHCPAETFKVQICGKTIFKCGIDKPERYYYQFRSAYYINCKYHDIYNLFFHVYKLIKVLFLFKNKKEYLRLIRFGIIDAKRGFFGNIKDRENY